MTQEVAANGAENRAKKGRKSKCDHGAPSFTRREPTGSAEVGREVAHMSEMTPPEFVSGDEPKAPARKRNTMSVSMFLLKPDPRVRRTNGA